jgi:hypothetical protein
VTTRRFVTTTLLGLTATAIALALAELLDASWLRLVAVALLLGIFIARESWHWWGAGRQWLLAVYATLLGVIALAFIAERLAD